MEWTKSMEALTSSLLRLVWSRFPEDSTYGVFMGGAGDRNTQEIQWPTQPQRLNDIKIWQQNPENRPQWLDSERRKDTNETALILCGHTGWAKEVVLCCVVFWEPGKTISRLSARAYQWVLTTTQHWEWGGCQEGEREAWWLGFRIRREDTLGKIDCFFLILEGKF